MKHKRPLGGAVIYPSVVFVLHSESICSPHFSVLRRNNLWCTIIEAYPSRRIENHPGHFDSMQRNGKKQNYISDMPFRTPHILFMNKFLF